MSLNLTATYPPQPATERARRSTLSVDRNSRKIAYTQNKLVIVRSFDEPLTASLVYTENLAPATAVEFSPCGHYIACGDANGQTRVFNASGEETITKGPFHAVAGKLNGIAFCPESSRLIAVGDGKDRMGHAFLADTGNAIGEIGGHAAEINAVAMRPMRPMRAVTVGDDGNIVFHEGPPFKFTRSIQKHTSSISDVDYSPNGEHFVTGGCDRQVGLFDGLTGEFVRWLETKHDGMVLSASFLTNDLVLTSSTDCTIRITNLEGELQQTFTLERKVENQITAVRAISDTEFVSVSLNGNVRLWSKDKQEPVTVLEGHQSAVSSINFANDELISGAMDGTVCRWTDQARKIAGHQHDGPVSGITNTYSVGWDKKVINLQSGNYETSENQLQSVCEFEGQLAGVGEPVLELLNKKSINITKGTAIDMNKDLIVIGNGALAQVYKTDDLTLAYEFPQRLADVSAVQISPNGELVAVGDNSGKITLFSLKDYSMVTSRWAFHTSRVTSIKFSKDGLHCLTGALDTNVYIYSVERPARNIKVLGAHKDGVQSVAWGNESTAYTGGSDGLIKKWEVSLS